MENITLPPDLERFAAEAVANGRFQDVSDVVAAGVGMLRRTEEARLRLLHSVQAAEKNGETNGFLTLDEVMEDADAVIAEMASRTK
jgi:antitoxin ParD1/3/4